MSLLLTSLRRKRSESSPTASLSDQGAQDDQKNLILGELVKTMCELYTLEIKRVGLNRSTINCLGLIAIVLCVIVVCGEDDV